MTIENFIDLALKIAPTVASLAAVAFTHAIDVKLLHLEIRMREHFAAKEEVEEVRERVRLLEQRQMRGAR